MTLRATHPMRAGEQVHIAYTDVLQPRATRVRELARKYEFECACVACALVREACDASDRRRWMLLRGPRLDEAYFGKWLAMGALALPEPLSMESAPAAQWAREGDAFAIAMFVWKMMEAEGLVYGTVWEPIAETLCKAYAVLEDGRRVKEWATVAARLSIAYHGEDAGWGAVAEAPEHNEWWGAAD